MGYGDTIVMIPIINKVLEKYKDVKITVGCFKHHAYLFEHLPVHIIGIDLHFMIRYHPFDLYMPDYCHSIYIWAGKRKETDMKFWWKNFVDIFNIECKERNLDYCLEYGNKWGEIQLPIYDVDVKENAVFVENGSCISGQNDFEMNINCFAHLFPEINFYCTAKPEQITENIFFNPDNTLIDHQNILRKCKGFIGKGSGPSHLNYLHCLDLMPKALFGYKLEEHNIVWDETFNYQYFEGSHDAIVDFIKANYNEFTK